MNTVLSRKRTIIGFLLPGVLVYVISVIIPIVWSSYYSFFEWNGLGDKSFIGFDNFAKMLQDTELWESVVNTIILTLWEIVLELGVGLAIALLLLKITRGRKVLQGLYYLPVIVSSVALCQMFKKIFAVNPVGIFNQIISTFNPEWISLELLTNVETSLAMVIFVTGYKSMATYMLIFYSALLTIPSSLLEAARIDGANALKTFWNITLPCLKPTIFANLILVVNGSLRAYDIPRLLTGGGPMSSSQTQAMYMYKQAFTSMKYGYGSSIAIFIVIEALLIALVIKQFSYRQKGGI